MCTVTIIPLAGTGEGGAGYRLKVNRDELRTRPEASPPVWRDVHASGVAGPSRRAIYPVDPKGGGTWVAAAPGGMAMAILNMNPTPAAPLPPDLISRGAIIPSLVGLARAGDVAGALDRMDLERYKPFRLIAMDLESVVKGVVRPIEAAWDRQSLTVTAHEDAGAGMGRCWASSGLGDAIVQVRLPLWTQMLGGASGEDAAAVEVQERFHTHRWADRTHQSVLMSRPDARTVSITTVEVRRAEGAGADVRMWYEAVADGAAAVVRGREGVGARVGL